MIDVHCENDVWTVTLNRPEKANALTAQMLSDILRVTKEAQDVAKVFILTGHGSVFSAGADLTEAHNGLAVSELWEQVSRAVAELPCLTVAALNGTVAGGAFGMTLACDMRIAMPHAQFFYPVMKLGFLPPPSDPKRMASLIGPARTKMIFMTGQKITVQEALSWGLIDRIAESEASPASLTETVQALCSTPLAANRSHITALKDMMPHHE